MFLIEDLETKTDAVTNKLCYVYYLYNIRLGRIHIIIKLFVVLSLLQKAYILNTLIQNKTLFDFLP